MRTMIVLTVMILRGGVPRFGAFIFIAFCLLAFYAISR